MDNCMRQATREELEAIRHKLEAERAKMAHPAELANAPMPSVTQWQEVLKTCYHTAEMTDNLARMLNAPVRAVPAFAAHIENDPSLAERLQTVMGEIVQVQCHMQNILDGCAKEIGRICGQLQRQD